MLTGSEATVNGAVGTWLHCAFWQKHFFLYYHLLFPGKSCSWISGHLTVQMSSEGSMCIPAAMVCIMCFNQFHFDVLCTFKSDLSSCTCIGIKLRAVRLEGLPTIVLCYVKPFAGWCKSPAEAFGHHACLKQP